MKKAPTAYEATMIGTSVNERIVDERTGIDGDFVEAKDEGNDRRQDRVETEER